MVRYALTSRPPRPAAHTRAGWAARGSGGLLGGRQEGVEADEHAANFVHARLLRPDLRGGTLRDPLQRIRHIREQHGEVGGERDKLSVRAVHALALIAYVPKRADAA